MTVFVDYMIILLVRMQNHVQNLEETFLLLRKYKMKLNPEKCTFGITSGKFVGFMVNELE